MRLRLVLLAVGAAWWPGAARAQFNLAPGTYQLASGGTGSASMKLVLAEGGSPTTVVGVKNGRERTFRSAELTTFTVEAHRFVQAKDFRFRGGADVGFPDPAILEVVETGPVELHYYYYQMEMGTNFKAHVKLPVLRKAGTAIYLPYSPSRTPGIDAKLTSGTFAAVLFPADPVLQRQFATNSITRAQLPDVVRAYNRGVRLKP